MHTAADATLPFSRRLPAGNIISAVPALFLLFDSFGKLMELAPVVDGTARLGYPHRLVLGIGVVELVCAVLYVMPRTAVLGAILLTGFLGGATATHVRVGDPFFFPIAVGVLIWGGLFLRDERVRALIPLRSRGAALAGGVVGPGATP